MDKPIEPICRFIHESVPIIGTTMNLFLGTTAASATLLHFKRGSGQKLDTSRMIFIVRYFVYSVRSKLLTRQVAQCIKT